MKFKTSLFTCCNNETFLEDILDGLPSGDPVDWDTEIEVPDYLDEDN